MTVLDAVVIGGGPGGSATALLLAQAGWSVAIIEQKAFPRRKVCGEYLSATNLPLLDRLGVGNVFRQEAGPPVRKVGLFTGTTVLEAGLPPLGGTAPLWGRALSRERLDTLLLERARQAGAQVHQPWKALTLVKENDVWRCALQAVPSGTSAMIEAGVVVAAHGSWDAGPCPASRPGGRRWHRTCSASRCTFAAARWRPILCPCSLFLAAMAVWSTARTAASACPAASGAIDWPPFAKAAPAMPAPLSCAIFANIAGGRMKCSATPRRKTPGWRPAP